MGFLGMPIRLSSPGRATPEVLHGVDSTSGGSGDKADNRDSKGSNDI
jgi:hypothetical protein